MLQFFHSAALTASVILAWAVFLGSNVAYAAPSDEEAVRKVVNEFPEAWNRHDMNAFGALFAPDADFVNVVGVRWKGREAIQMNHAFVHGEIPIDTPGITAPKAIYGIFKTSTLLITRWTCVSYARMSLRLMSKRNCSATRARKILGEPLPS